MVGVQSIKDTFYGVLRARVMAGNPGRTLVVRGVARPAVVVVENELPGAAGEEVAQVECFWLRWTGMQVKEGLTRLGCELRYATDGTAGAGGMDRGRALAAMDTELIEAIDTSPQNAARNSASEGMAGLLVETPVGTNVFWSDLVLGAAATRGERMERTATLEVFGYD